MISRALIRATQRLTLRSNTGDYFKDTNLSGIDTPNDNKQKKIENKNEATTSDTLFPKNNNNNKLNNNIDITKAYKYRAQRKQTHRQPIEKPDPIFKKGDFNPNILSFTWMPSDPAYNLQHFSAHLRKIVEDKTYPNHRCIEAWIHIFQRGEHFQPDPDVYVDLIHILVETKMPIPIDLFESALRAVSPNINYVPSQELKALIDNHQMLFTVIQELLVNKIEDDSNENDLTMSQVARLFEYVVESTTLLQKSNYSMIALAQMFLMNVPRTTRVWTLLFVQSSALTADEQCKLFKLLPKADLSLLTGQIMESLFFVSDENSSETILKQMVDLRLKPTSNFCSIYISKLKDKKDYPRIIAFYQWMLSENIKLEGANTMTSIITACHQTHNLTLVDNMLADPQYQVMVNSLDTPLLNSLVNHYARQHNIEKMEHYMNKLTRDQHSNYRALVTLPTFHLYLTMLAKYDSADAAVDLWSNYRKSHSKFRFLSPDAFLTIVNALLKEKTPEVAIAFIKKACNKVDIMHFKPLKAVFNAYYAGWAQNKPDKEEFLDISKNSAELTAITEQIFEHFLKYNRNELEQLSNSVMRDLVQEKKPQLMWTWFHIMKTKGLLLSFNMLVALEQLFNELKLNQLASVVAKEKVGSKKIVK